jgi:mannose-6-phosphate isomerase-like protein (cupin superfamily)
MAHKSVSDRIRVIHLADAEARIPGSGGERSISFVRRGSLDLLLSQPLPPNQSKTHEQNEVYVIVRGRAVFLSEDRHDSVQAGDCIFVAAGTEHHFEDFSPDLTVWVMFYGPAGGDSV